MAKRTKLSHMGYLRTRSELENHTRKMGIIYEKSRSLYIIAPTPTLKLLILTSSIR